MASQYSILRNYGEYVSPYNIDLIAQGMEYLQGKVDTNRQVINDYVDQIVNSDIVKPQDREYLQNRLNGIINDVNDSFRRSNLSSDGVARSIQSRLGEAVDTRVMNAIAGTREFRNLQKTIEDIKLNKPKEYSAVNEAMAYMPFYQWFNDGQVGSRLEPLHYTPYYDYNSEIDAKMKEAVSLRKATKRQDFLTNEDSQRTGEIAMTTVDRFTPEEVWGVAMNSLSRQAMAQINLEGQYMAMTNPGLFNQQSTESFIKRYTDSYDQRESALLGELRNASGDENKKAELNARLSNLRAQRDAFVDEASSFIGQSYDPARAGAFVVRNEFLRGVASRWSYDNSYTVTEKDEFYFAKQRENREVARFEFDKWKAQQDFNLRRQNLEIARQREANRSSDRSGDGSGNGSSRDFPQGFGTQVTLATPEEDRRPVKEFYDKYAMNENEKAIAERVFMDSLSDADRKSINDAIDVALSDPGTSHLYDGCSSDADYVMRYFDINGGASAGMLQGRDAQDAYDHLTHLRDRERAYNSIESVASDRRDGIMSGFDQEVIRAVRDSAAAGIDVPVVVNGEWTSMNAGDILRIGADMNIGGVMVRAADAIRLSALTQMISETRGAGGGVSDSGMAKTLLDRANAIMGTDMTLDELDLLLGGRSDGYLGKVASYRERTAADPAMGALSQMIVEEQRRANLPVGRKWTNYPVADLVRTASEEYSRVFDQYYDRFGERTYVFSSSTTGTTKEEQDMFRSLSNIYSRLGGSEAGLATLSVVKRDGQSYLVGTYQGDSKNPQDGAQVIEFNVSEEDLNASGYTTYTRDREVRSELYETPHAVRLSFGSPANRDYGRKVVREIGLPYATVDDARNSMSMIPFSNPSDNRVYLSDNKTYLVGTMRDGSLMGDGKRIEMEAIRDAIIDNIGEYEIKAEGYRTRTGSTGVNVGIYYKGQADNGGSPLYVVEHEDTPYADEIARKVNICPQAFMMDALNTLFNIELNNYTINGNRSRTVELQNLISPTVVRNAIDENIRGELGMNQTN